MNDLRNMWPVGARGWRSLRAWEVATVTAAWLVFQQSSKSHLHQFLFSSRFLAFSLSFTLTSHEVPYEVQ